MFQKALKIANEQVGSNVKDGSYVVDFYGNKEFDGLFGKATAHVRNGKVVGLEDYYNFDKKPWGERSLLAEIATRFGHDPNGAPFHVYGGMIKKRY